MKQVKKSTIYFSENTSFEDFSSYLSERFTVQIDSSFENPVFFIESKDVKTVNLKPKEVELLNHLRDGLTYNQVAEKMGFSVDGVRYYIKNIYRKLEANNVRQALKNHFG